MGAPTLLYGDPKSFLDPFEGYPDDHSTVGKGFVQRSVIVLQRGFQIGIKPRRCSSSHRGFFLQGCTTPAFCVPGDPKQHEHTEQPLYAAPAAAAFSLSVGGDAGDGLA